MNNELEKALVELINRTSNGMDSASAFLTAQIPDVIQQLLLWHGVKSFLFFSFGVSLLFLIPKVIRLSNASKASALDAYNNGESWTRFCSGSSTTSGQYDAIMATTSFSGYAQAVVGCLFIFNNLEWLQIIITPKVWLLEYASRLSG